ncbi:MAG: SH3 domain-containing protein [Caldilineales bacterium]|nr:SH3 domain-containing protein [Caldilineales bacterium]
MIRLIFLTIVSLALISCQSSTGALGSLIATITPTPEPTATATPVPPTPTPEPTATTTPTPIPDVIATALFSANLRQGPGTDYARVGGVAIGEQFIVIGKNEQGNWW